MTIETTVNKVIDPNIFRAYDIRGIVDRTLTEDLVFLIGQAIGTKTLAIARQISNAVDSMPKVLVARDGRLSGPRLIAKLKEGILVTGCQVVDLGLVPTPLLYFASQTWGISSAVMLTGSHNPVNYNGLKIILDNKAIHSQEILELRELIINNRLITAKKQSQQHSCGSEIIGQYIDYVTNNIQIERSDLVKKPKVVIDCGNGAAGVVAEKLFTKLGAECVCLYCDVDGNFPNHHPDPSDPVNLTKLQQTVLDLQADFGLAFDGDGDRLGVIDNHANIIWPDRYLMLFIKDILANYEYHKNNGQKFYQRPVIIYDIKSTNNLESVIKKAGGMPLMWKTGHSLIKAKMKELQAILAGEMSGHVFFNDRWFGFDDGLYAAARLLELVVNSGQTLQQMCQDLPNNKSTPELTIKSSEDQKRHIINQLIEQVSKLMSYNKTAKITTIDGLRVDFIDSWGLVRFSNTTPNLIARFEGQNLTSLSRIKNFFKYQLLSIDPNLVIPF